MRFMASVRCSTEYAYDTRQYPSPEAPKASPGTSATCFCSSSRVQNSWLVIPVDLMQGKA